MASESNTSHGLPALTGYMESSKDRYVDEVMYFHSNNGFAFMDLDAGNPLILSLTYFCQGKSVDELRQMVVCANVELQTVRIQAQEEIKKRDKELRDFRSVLSKVVKERDEAREKFQRLMLDGFSRQKENKSGPVSGVTSNNDDEVKRRLDSGNNGFSTSEGDESIVSSPVIDPLHQPPSMTSSSNEEMMELLLKEQRERALPEQGKLLDAVMNAGPLLQTLLLAGPLPQWRHPPPPLESSQIPPVAIPSPPLHPHDTLPCSVDYSNEHCGRLDRKRRFLEGSVTSTKTKCHRILLN